MNTKSPHVSLQLEGETEVRVLIENRLSLREGSSSVLCCIELPRVTERGLCNIVAVVLCHLDRDLKDLGDRLNRGLTSEPREVADVTDVLRPVDLPSEVKDLVASVVLVVRINVWCIRSSRIKEALENHHRELHRINFSQTEEITHERSRSGTSAWSDDDSVVLGPPDDLLVDQEVIREVLRQNCPEFLLNSGFVFLLVRLVVLIKVT